MIAPMATDRVLVRPLSPRFGACLRQDHRASIDVARAREQHTAYVTALRSIVKSVIEVEAAEAHPDGVFVEDTVVMLDPSHGVITRMGAPVRRPEAQSVATQLVAMGIELQRLTAPATLDGGDVLRIGGQLFVALSQRSNAEGAAALRRMAGAQGVRTTVLALRQGLHLKSSCSIADEQTVLYDPAALGDPAPFAELGLTCLPVEEPLGANVLALGGGRVMVSAASPKTAARLRDRGLQVTMVDVSELHKADAAMTCPSVRIPAPGAWCT